MARFGLSWFLEQCDVDDDDDEGDPHLVGLDQYSAEVQKLELISHMIQ